MTIWNLCCMRAALRLRVLLQAGFDRREIMADPERHWVLADEELGKGV